MIKIEKINIVNAKLQKLKEKTKKKINKIINRREKFHLAKQYEFAEQNKH